MFTVFKNYRYHYRHLRESVTCYKTIAETCEGQKPWTESPMNNFRRVGRAVTSCKQDTLHCGVFISPLGHVTCALCLDRSKRGVCCLGQQPGDLWPRSSHSQPCGRDSDDEGGLSLWARQGPEHRKRNRDSHTGHLWFCRLVRLKSKHFCGNALKKVILFSVKVFW